VYARHGRELMGCPFDPAQGKGSPLYVNPVNVSNIVTKVRAEGKGIAVRWCLKEDRAQRYEPTNPAKSGTCKATSKGKVAQHTEAPGSEIG
jgi:hypothetical protein